MLWFVPFRSRAVVLLLSGGFALALGACFNGEDAAGLPCEVDEECGVGQRCKLGFCDGPSGSGCGNGAVEAGEECDEGSDNADEAACKADCTLNVCGDGKVGPGEACDDGNRDDTDGCGNDCTLGSCGDGKIDPGEECDEAGQNDDTASCTTACKRNVCGDGLVFAGMEACDDGGESESCDADCTVPECGDGEVNAAYGEECDGGGAASSAACMDNCTEPLLWDDAESELDGYTESQNSANEVGYTSDWSRATIKAASGANAWSSGVRVPEPSQLNYYAGSSRLETPEIDLTGIEAPVRLEFVHNWEFDEADSNWEADGATVEVFADGAWQVVAPEGGYPYTLEDEDDCAGLNVQPNPLVGTMVWSHSSPGADDAFVPAQFDLSAFAGEKIRIGFHVSYDCTDNTSVTTDGWFVDDIVVWRPVTLGQ